MYHFLFYNISHSKTLLFAGVINVELISKYSSVTEAEFYITLHSTCYISIHTNILCCFASYQCQSKEFVKNQCDYKDHLQRKEKEKKRSQLKVHLKTDSFSRLICSNNLSPNPCLFTFSQATHLLQTAKIVTSDGLHIWDQDII